MYKGDRLLITKNVGEVDGKLNPLDFRPQLLNGDMLQVVSVGRRKEHRVQWEKKEDGSYAFDVTLRFRLVEVNLLGLQRCPNGMTFFILENFLYSDDKTLPRLEANALYEDLHQRHPGLYRISRKDFLDIVRRDKYYNALLVKFGYAMTCHKAQGGEWDYVVLDQGRLPWLRGNSVNRWLYTAITRAKKKVFLMRSILPGDSLVVDLNFLTGKPFSDEQEEDMTVVKEDYSDEYYPNPPHEEDSSSREWDIDDSILYDDMNDSACGDWSCDECPIGGCSADPYH
jgi:hypothetical protein